MGETTQEDRDYAFQHGIPAQWERQFIHDADRLAAIERHIEALAERMKIADENLTHDGRHKEAQFVRHWISDMRAILDPPEVHDGS